MKKLDPQLTKRLQDWLNADASERSTEEGATLILQITRNRALHNSFLRRPDKFMAKVEYELKKYLSIRLAGMTALEVSQMQTTVMAQAEETITTMAVITTDDELPEGVIAKGKRADHDRLPASIQKLWESNGPRYRKMVLLFNELKNKTYSSLPCDLFEELKILEDLDSTYRRNLERYDSYQLVENLDNQPSKPEEPEPDPETEKKIAASRKTISKYRKMWNQTEAGDVRAKCISKIQDAVNIILSLGGEFKADTLAELQQMGVKFA